MPSRSSCIARWALDYHYLYLYLNNVDLLTPGRADGWCSGHSHFEIPVMDEVLDIPIDTLFQYCFTNSSVFRRFLDARKTHGELSHHCLSHFSLISQTELPHWE